MSSIRRILLLALPIPLLFTVGVVAFFYILPNSSQNLSNFISYTSSLSTILMVLVVIVTTTLQTKEMALTRVHQFQPFLSVTPSDKSKIEELKMWQDRPRKIADLGRRLFFSFTIENIGNGPAIAVNIIPSLKYLNDEKKEISVSPIWTIYDSLKESEKKDEAIMFVGETIAKSDFPECIMRGFLTDKIPCGGYYSRSKIEMIIYYKNVLGAAFKEELCFEILLRFEDEEKIKAALKLLATFRIDKGNEITKLNSLIKTDEQKANGLFDEMNKQLSKNEGSKMIPLEINSLSEKFSVRPISEAEYRKAVARARLPLNP